jgi:hypothetical protein
MSKPVLRIVLLLVAALAIPGLSSAQSLGSVAKKERQRRDKNKEKGVVSHEYTEEEVSGEKKDDAKEGEGPDSVSGGDKDQESDEAASPLPEPFDSKSNAAQEDSDKESRDRRRSEAEWKARMQQARENVSQAREQVRILSELYLAQGERYVDENGKTVVSSPEQLQRLTQQAKDELAAAEKALTNLQEEARHAGVPPGWLR